MQRMTSKPLYYRDERSRDSSLKFFGDSRWWRVWLTMVIAKCDRFGAFLLFFTTVGWSYPSRPYVDRCHGDPLTLWQFAQSRETSHL